MARGWESKSVEDQIASAEAGKGPTGPILSPRDQERVSRKAGLLLSRTRILKDLENAGDSAYRATLQRALEFLDAQIAALNE